MLDERVISADDHLDLDAMPPSLFTERVPVALRERVPVVVDTAEGPCWSVEGRQVGPSGRRPGGQIVHEPLGLRPGDPETRLEDMDRDGVHAHVIYGPAQGLSAFLADVDVRAACARAFNDFGVEFNAADPNRLVLLAILPAHEPAAAIEELQRIASLGHRGAILPLYEAENPPFEDGWDPFWAAANEVGIPIHFHLGGGVFSIRARRRSWRFGAYCSVIPMQLDEPLCAMIFSGVFERHPNVSLVLGEAGLGWIPYLLERMNHEHEKYKDLTEDVSLSARPSEYFQRNVRVTYEQDEIGLELIDRIGARNVMWASDYPHGDSTWPQSRKAIEESPLGGIDEARRRRIVWDNAAELYQIR